MTKFQQYAEKYGYIVDEDYKAFNLLFTKQSIKNISIEVYNNINKSSETLLLRTKINKPFPLIIRNRYKFTDNDKNVIADIPMELINECIYKQFSNNLTEYQIALSNGISYIFIVKE